MLPRQILALATLCLSSLPSSTASQPCGRKIAPCRDDQKCVPDSPLCTNLNFCRGSCRFKNEYAPCGGFRIRPLTCPHGFECRDDPRLPPGQCGLACDGPGVCLPVELQSCGGIAGFRCPEGLHCYDMPNDGCDPEGEGADCVGVCL